MVPVRLSLALLLIGLGTFAARGQEQSVDEAKAIPDTVVQRVATAFTDGDAQLLLTPAADRVEVSLFGTRTFYSDAQAFYVLREFFDAHPPSDFQVGDVTETGKSCFVRGQFAHDRGERMLQVYVRLVRREKAWQLQEIRINSDVE